MHRCACLLSESLGDCCTLQTCRSAIAGRHLGGCWAECSHAGCRVAAGYTCSCRALFVCFLHGRIQNPACKDPNTSQGLQGRAESLCCGPVDARQPMTQDKRLCRALALALAAPMCRAVSARTGLLGGPRGQGLVRPVQESTVSFMPSVATWMVRPPTSTMRHPLLAVCPAWAATRPGVSLLQAAHRQSAHRYPSVALACTGIGLL